MSDNNQQLVPAPGRRPAMIKGLIPQLPERGRIKIGAKGEVRKAKGGNEYQLPVKLDHFVVTTLERGRDGNFLPDEQIMLKLGSNPTSIPVRLLYDDVELNFPTRLACYVGRALWCSGDGEVATRMTTTPQEMADKARIEPRAVSCPCHRSEPGYTGNDKCKMNGSLSVLIDGAGGIGGVWRFRTTSYNSIVGLLSSMSFIKQISGGVLANLPLLLRLQPKQATAPDGGAVQIYIVGLEFSGDMAALQDAAHTVALHRAKTHVSIEHIEEEAKRVLALAPPLNAVLPGDDPDDVVEEFYPEQTMPAECDPEPPRGRDVVHAGGNGAPANPPQGRAAAPGTSVARGSTGSPEPTARGPANSQAGRGPTAPTNASRSDAPGGRGWAAEMVEQIVQSQTLPDVPLYSVTDCDGVVTETDNLSAAADQLQAVFTDAQRRGPNHVAAARENNEALIREIGEPQLSPVGGSPQDHGRPATRPVAPSGRNNTPIRTPTGEPQNPTGGGPAGPAERGPGVTSTGPSPGPSSTGKREAPPRSPIWGEASFRVELHHSNGGPDFKRLIHDLVFLAEEATDAEFDKLKADNKEQTQRLRAVDSDLYRELQQGWEAARKSPIDG